jgi:hypothetical protein
MSRDFYELPLCPRCGTPVTELEFDPRVTTISVEEQEASLAVALGNVTRPPRPIQPIFFYGLPRYVARCHGVEWRWDGPVERCAEAYRYTFEAPR